jgi:hypothetical protein
MTEADWLACDYPARMLEYLRGKASDRKLRLFAVDCCLRHGDQIAGSSGRYAITVGEQLADGVADASGVSQIREALRKEARSGSRTADATMRLCSYYPFDEVSVLRAFGPWLWITGDLNREEQEIAVANELAIQATLVRELFANPFRPLTINSSWLSSTVKNLAELIYAARAFDRMPILGDALEDAGCSNADILHHCRSG